MKCPTCSHEFVDAGGAAMLLGISKGRFHNLLSAGESGMPPPVGLVGRSPLWSLAAVREFAESRPRRRVSPVPMGVGLVPDGGGGVGGAAQPGPITDPTGATSESAAGLGGDHCLVDAAGVPGGRWVAVCSCGWVSAAMRSVEAAVVRFDLHSNIR